MEIGIGIHGEPGVHRGRWRRPTRSPSGCSTRSSTELDLARGDRVAVLVNGLGATPLEELYLLYRRVHQVLGERGVTDHRATSASTPPAWRWPARRCRMLRLDDERLELLDAPASSPFFREV